MLLGYDLGSSSIKAALLDPATGRCVATAQYPDTELEISAPRPGWAEQDPEQWWQCVVAATRRLLAAAPSGAADAIQGIGISYQMHGLVTLDRQGRVVRPSIIWCDSRALEAGQAAVDALGERWCLEHCLNTPGNFTAAKLAWVRRHEPAAFARIHRIALPGDYVAFRMTGELRTTVTGLSEGVFYDFMENKPASALLEALGLDPGLLPETTPVFGMQGALTREAAEVLGLRAGVPVSYRAGDQPNNALSLNVLRPGEVAATAGTSGVVYAVVDRPVFDPAQRVNSFAHVNYTPEDPRTGVLLCINGAGSAYRWLRQMLGGPSYDEMNRLAAASSSDGLTVLPFGNGAERMLGNRLVGAQWLGLDFNRHGPGQLCRATLEGVACAFAYGLEALRDLGVEVRLLRVGNDNLFRSAVFAETLAGLSRCAIEVYDTNGAAGAARGAGLGAGAFQSFEAAFEGIGRLAVVEPGEAERGVWERWREEVLRI